MPPPLVPATIGAMSSPFLKRLLAGVAALVVVAIAAPAASADSIAYVKDGNVWLSTSDGARQYQVTTTGGYSDVSQADDGTMIAPARRAAAPPRPPGPRARRLRHAGLRHAPGAGPRRSTGPYDPAISPDGTKVAYTYYYMTQSQNADTASRPSA